MNKILKLGLDVHGVCDTYPQLFADLSKLFVNGGHEVHIITGQEYSDEFAEQIRSFGIQFTHFFSVTDYHKELGTEIWYNEKGRPYMDGHIWNRTKGEYCEKVGITLHIDDTLEYARHFKDTVYLLISN